MEKGQELGDDLTGDPQKVANFGIGDICVPGMVSGKSIGVLVKYYEPFGAEKNPYSLPNTSWEGVLGMFLGSKYLLTRCLEA